METLVPMAHKLHWGMVTVEDQKIFWAGRLRSKPFGTRYHTVLEEILVCDNLFSKDQWVIERKIEGDYCNYMQDLLQFEKQRDGYSCGLYVLSTICGFWDSVGGLPAFPYT